MGVSSGVASDYAAIFAASGTTACPAKNTASGSAATALSTQTDTDPDVAVTFSSRAQELMRRRAISPEAARQFKDILARSTAPNAQTDPKAFLHSLSASDMEVLRQVHCLADSINISSLSQEGAANLLVQPGSAQDRNNDGLTAVGAGYGFTFPPRNAPESFKAAWASATEGMSEMDIPTHMIFAVGLANLGREPGDPNWRNPYADPDFDYKSAVRNSINSVKFNYQHGGISAERYQIEMDFYTRLTKAMG